MSAKINIGWYTRDGDLEYFAKVSKKLLVEDHEIKSHYICHTRAEYKTLQNQFDVFADVLGDYTHDISISDKDDIKHELNRIRNQYPFMPMRKLVWGDMYELNRSDRELAIDIVSHFKFFEKFCIENKIKVIVSEGPGILATNILWTICHKHDILFVEYTPVGLPGRKNFRTSWEDGIHGIDAIISNVQVDESSDYYHKAEEYLDTIKSKYTPPPYVGIDLNTGKKIKANQSYWSFPKKSIGLSTIFKAYGRAVDRRNNNNYYLSKRKVFQPYLKWITTGFRHKRLKYSKLFANQKSLKTGKYFFFPLHILHEWCDYPWMGPRYNKIDEVIGMVSDSLPLGYQLVVKEHPALFPEKSIKFYKKLKSIRNVILLGPSENTHSIIKNSAGVVTLGSTSGWESFLIGKPVYLLADSWYRNFPGVKRVENIFQLVTLLQNHDQVILPERAEKLKIIYSLFQSSFPAKHYPIVEINSEWNVAQSSTAIGELIAVEFGNEQTRNAQ
jgi:hypothetical protein